MLGELYLYIYDTNLNSVAIIDQYKSLIWSDRYNDCGEFELEIVYDKSLLKYLKHDYFCRVDYSNHWAVIEKIEVKTDEDEPSMMIVSGRSLECLLERRVILEKTEFSNADLQTAVESMLNTNIISPSDSDRRIPNFIMNINEDPAITGLTITESYNGEDLFSIISGICQEKNIGFIIYVNDSMQFVFQLYSGQDRSFSQIANSFVVFSPDYDNLKNSSYYISKEEYRNTMVVSTSELDYVVVSLKTTGAFERGLERREVQTDVNGLKANQSSTLTNSQIGAKARKKLKDEFNMKSVFEGDIVPNVMYSYMEDFYTGDIVQFRDIYGNQKAMRISEMVISYDENGLEMVPSFTDPEDEGD